MHKRTSRRLPTERPEVTAGYPVAGEVQPTFTLRLGEYAPVVVRDGQVDVPVRHTARRRTAFLHSAPQVSFERHVVRLGYGVKVGDHAAIGIFLICFIGLR